MRSLLVYILIISVGAVFAQPTAPGFYLRGGSTMPFTPDFFSENWSSNYNIAGGFRLPLSSETMLGIELTYHHFVFDEASAREYSSYAGYILSMQSDAATVESAIAHLVYRPDIFTGPLQPALIIGVGLSTVNQPAIVTEVNLPGGSAGQSVHEGNQHLTGSFHLGLEVQMRLIRPLSLVLSGMFAGTPGDKQISGYSSYSAGLAIDLAAR